MKVVACTNSARAIPVYCNSLDRGGIRVRTRARMLVRVMIRDKLIMKDIIRAMVGIGASYTGGIGASYTGGVGASYI